MIWGFYGHQGEEGQAKGHLEIHPCVLQDIGPLGPLPKENEKEEQGVEEKEEENAVDATVPMMIILSSISSFVDGRHFLKWLDL